ncbi:MAG: Gldg family protein [Lachnospiraceae bacterium]|nr:Gldg family protein [Lachnospiraceae bacterium]
MLAIYKREIKAYFTTMIGYVFVAVSLFLIGLGFFAYNLYQERPYFSYTIQGCTLVLLVTIPFLTMNLLVREKKAKTEQMLLSSSASVASIAVGKFLAAFSVFLIPCVISCVYPLILNRFGTVPIAEAYVAILGFVFYGAACIAIGMFFSSIVKYQVLAAILSFIVLFLGYIMASIISLFTATEGLISNILGVYDLSTPLNYMTNGVIDFVAIFYYVSMTALFIFLTAQSIQKRRCTVTAKNFFKCEFNIIGIIVAIAIFVTANIFVKKIPDRYSTVDCSYSGLFSISAETKDYIEGLEEDVTIYVLNSREGYDEYVRKLLDKYEEESEHIKVEYIDQYLYPRFYLQYTDTAPEAGSLIIIGSKNTKIVGYSYLYEYDYSNYYQTGSVEISGFVGENQINNAIDYVTNGNLAKVYVVTGHGETEFETAYYDAITVSGAEYENVKLDDVDGISGKISGIIINGATKDISESDLAKLTDYLDNGGKILITLAHTEEDTPNLDELLDYMEINVVTGMVIENDPNYYYQECVYLIPDMITNKYTEDLPEYPLLTEAVGMMVNDYSEYVSYDSFLYTTEDAFLKVNYKESTIFNEHEGDYEGRFVVGVDASRQITDEKGIVTNPEMIAIASSNAFSTAMDAMVNNTNILLFANIVGTFVEESSVTNVSAKALSLQFLEVGRTDRNVIVIITMLLIPLGVIACGIYTCMKRKKN